ncbi:hypothetical protein [Planomonospora parontospora]|uniref:hypothetical protein n=1 Tax=Planomonospora parontospora TaxID=58119 RepID=UPI001670999D|nr:hypothetical protein [Planomonospora parontospora]GGL56175.1 hypothetical protein GCM10014719_66930 [Planomonospora parontospora subsp. antibiotica]GII19160.1 hypothetical protein Ppa05_58860 [Planomonospora parontospora subsp. antibiotica]
MAGVDLHYEALERCRTAAKTLAGKFADLGAGYPAKGTDSSVFGRLADSSALATAVDEVETAVDGELGHATSRLKGVERALDLVQDNVRGANRAGGAAEA